MKPQLLVLLLSLPLAAAELKRETLDDFAKYIRDAEAGMEKTLNTGLFLRAEQARALDRVRGGEMVVEPVVGKGEFKVRDGLIHDWSGVVFIPNSTAARVVEMVQNYDNHKNVYQPEVIDSKLVGRNGNDFKVFLRLLKKKVLTVVLDTDHDVRYFEVNPKRWHSRSYTTRIAEVEDYGKPGQHTQAPDSGHGFLWRLYSYWRFDERGRRNLRGVPGDFADARCSCGTGLADHADRTKPAAGEPGADAAGDS